jgi:hypothetical protein
MDFTAAPAKDLTPAQCREKAADKLADAARNIGRTKTKLQDDAASWLLLAARLEATD